MTATARPWGLAAASAGLMLAWLLAQHPLFLTTAFASGGAAPVEASQARTAGHVRGFAVDEVAPGVYALIRVKAPGFLSDCNVVFIVNDDDVVVVDTNLTPASAEASIAALRAITPKPVRYVVNTHWHVDHVSGNQVYTRAFPGAEIIGQRHVRDDLVAKGAANRKDMGEQGRQFAATMRQQVAAGKSLTGTAITPEERRSYEEDLQLIDQLVAAMPSIEIVPPTIVVDDSLVLHRGSRTIEIRRLGRSHTQGDLVVFLPGDRVVVTGDVLVGPTPLIGGDQSYISEWVTSLDRLLQLGARTYVPGHGPVYRDDAQVALLRDLMRTVDDYAAAAVARGETLEQARAGLNLDRFRQRMAGDDAALRVLFANYGKGPALTAAFRERLPQPARPPAPIAK